MSIISEQAEAASYVPEVFSKMSVRPTSCQLVAKTLEGNQTEYTYRLQWEADADADGGHPFTLRDLSAVALGSSASGPRPRNKTDSAHSDVDKIMRKAAQQLASEDRSAPSGLPQSVLCDGPCGKEYRPSDLQFLGRCDHNLCNLCSGIITNLDGSPGCSAFTCAYFGVYDFLPEPLAKEAYDTQIRPKVMEREKLRKETEKPLVVAKKKASRYSISDLSDRGRGSSSRLTLDGLAPARVRSKTQQGDASDRSKSSRKSKKSTSSKKSTGNNRLFTDMSLLSLGRVTAPSENEFVHVRLMILEHLAGNPDKKIYKRVMQDELPARTIVKDAIGAVLGDRLNTLLSPNHACPLRLYFYAGLKGDQIRKLTCEEFEMKTLLDFTRNHGSVHFVLDSADAVKKIGLRKQ